MPPAAASYLIMVNYVDPNTLSDSVAESVNKDLGEQAEVAGHLAELQAQYKSMPADTVPLVRARLELELADAMQFLKQGEEAWPLARGAFDVFLEAEEWELATRACEVLYKTGQPDFLSALGQGVWLGVTYPIAPELTIEMLSHVVEDTPDDSDGAAVAAATAAFIADVRCEEGSEKEQLQFFSQQLLGKVARRHSNVENEQQFRYWIEKLELDQPEKFLVRLRNIVDVLVQTDWWFDREALQEKIPE